MIKGILVLFLLSASILADLSLYGTTFSIDSLGDTIPGYMRKIGNGNLKEVELTIVNNVSYLEVIEKSTIYGSYHPNFSLNGYLPSLTLSGEIELPDQAVVIGSSLQRGGISYSGSLTLESTEDTAGFIQKDTVGNSKIFELKKISDKRYSIELSKLKNGLLNEVTFHYLIPNRGNGTSRIPVPVLFNCNNGSNPERYSVTVKPGEQQSCKLITNTGKMVVTVESNFIINYDEHLEIEQSENTKSSSVIYTTSIAANEWAGYYMQLNTNIPDSTIGALSKEMEVVFLWRWNNPSSFTKFNEYKGNTISYNGQKCVEQAKLISNTITELSTKNNGTALIHSIDSKDMKVFPMAFHKTKEIASIQSYLSQFNEQYILNTYMKEDNDIPYWIPDEVKEEKKNSIEEFENAINAAVSLYTGSDGILRHLVVLSAGPVKNIPNSIDKNWLVQQLEGVTVDASAALWRGVSFDALISDNTAQNLHYKKGFYYPPHEPENVGLTISNSGKSYTFFLSTVNANNFALKAASSFPWNTTLSWTGYDKDGNIMGKATSTPTIIATQEDTALVKLWAGDDTHIDELNTQDLGKEFGILTTGNSLTAYQSDTALALNKSDYIVPNTIQVPVSLKKSGIAVSYFSAIMNGSILKLSLPLEFQGQRIEIYSLNGRLLKTILLNPSDTIRSIDLSKIGVSSSILVIRFVGAETSRIIRCIVK